MGENKKAMTIAMKSMMETNGNAAAANRAVAAAGYSITIPRQTLNSRWEKVVTKAWENEKRELGSDVSDNDEAPTVTPPGPIGIKVTPKVTEKASNLAMFDRKSQQTKEEAGTRGGAGGSKSLTSSETRQLLQSVAVARDHNNKGMARKEMVAFIAEIEKVSIKTADNHYQYLVRSNQLPDLKQGGRVVAS